MTTLTKPQLILPHINNNFPLEAMSFGANHAVESGMYFSAFEFVNAEDQEQRDKFVAEISDGRICLARMENYDNEEMIFQGDDFVIAVKIEYDTESRLTVFGKDYEACAAYAKMLHDKYHYVFEVEPADDNETLIHIWTMGQFGPERITRSFVFDRWDEIKGNYGSEAREHVDYLMGNKPDQPSGVMVWTGPPGTGKTTAIRTLTREWRDWASVHVIADTEVFLKNPSYLYGVASATHNANVIVLEDSGELLTNDAHKNSGQALSRLLNFTDGILGQGLNTYFMITTNENFESLHGAVARPGRAIPHGVVDFDKFNHNDALDWLARHGVVVDTKVQDRLAKNNGASLAELYAAKNGVLV